MEFTFYVVYFDPITLVYLSNVYSSLCQMSKKYFTWLPDSKQMIVIICLSTENRLKIIKSSIKICFVQNVNYCVAPLFLFHTIINA